jgi:bacterioferritin (cytochrome b1)
MTLSSEGVIVSPVKAAVVRTYAIAALPDHPCGASGLSSCRVAMPHPPPSRRDVLRAGSAIAGAVALGGCGGGGSGPAPSARAPAGPVHVLNAALVVEHTTLYAYAQGSSLLGAATAPLGTAFRQHHLDHRDRLSSLITGLGGRPAPARSRYDIGAPPTDENGMLNLVATLEEEAARSHDAALRQISDPAILQALASIMAAEAQHSAALRTVLQQDPAPEALVSG